MDLQQLVFSSSLLLLNNVLHVLLFFDAKEWLSSSVFLQKLCILTLILIHPLLLLFLLLSTLLVPLL